jgi:hypothetical protein
MKIFTRAAVADDDPEIILEKILSPQHASPVTPIR